MKFEDNEAASGSHVDYDKNLEHYHSMLKRVEFAPEVCVSLQKDGLEILCAMFIFGPAPTADGPGRRTGSFILSFHLTHGKFSWEIDGIFNTMMRLKLLKRIDLIPKKSHWDEIFEEK